MGITSHPGGPICRCAMCINAAGVATTVSKSPGLGIRSFAQIAQIKWATVSDSLRTNERLWANPSGRSCQKSNLLRSLMINERFAQKNWLHCKIVFLVRFLYFFMSDLLIPSFLMSDVSDSLRSLTKNERSPSPAKGGVVWWKVGREQNRPQSSSLHDRQHTQCKLFVYSLRAYEWF